MSHAHEVVCGWTWREARVNPARLCETRNEDRVDPCWKGRGRWKSTRTVKRDQVRLHKLDGNKYMTVIVDYLPVFVCRVNSDWRLLLRQEGIIVR